MKKKKKRDPLYVARLRAIQETVLGAEALVRPDSLLGRRDPLERRRMLAEAVFRYYRKGDGPGTAEPAPEPMPV